MKAYICQSPQNIEIVNREKPVPRENQVLIKVKNIGICGSDVSLFKGIYSGPHNYPLLFGHEWSGIVEEVGNGVENLKVGDKVTGDCSRYCGECEYCKIDKNLCEHIEKYGITIDGASAEYIVRDVKYVYKAPEELDFDLICLTEPIAVAAHMIKKITRITSDLVDKNILIMGGGPIGLASLMMLKRAYNCSNVDLYDIVKNRTDLALKLGARKPDQEIFDTNNTIGDYNSMYSDTYYDIIVETTGNEKAFADSFHIVKPLGTIGCVGMIQQATIVQKLIVLKSLTVIGNIGGTGEFEEVLNFMKLNSDYVRSLVSHKFPIEAYAKAFETCKDTSTAIKVQLYFAN